MHETTLTLLDSYCERAGTPGIWAEPLNALTNLCFAYVAYLAWRSLQKRGDHSFRHTGDIYLLIAALFSISIGSGLWHMYADRQTMLADVIPITVFINIYLLSAMRRILRLHWMHVILLWVLYQAFTVWAQLNLSAGLLNGTVMYMPTYITLVLLTAAICVRDIDTGIEFVQVLGLWSISLIFRTVDLWICPMFTLGTHFLWHILNAYVLYRLLMAVMARLR